MHRTSQQSAITQRPGLLAAIALAASTASLSAAGKDFVINAAHRLDPDDPAGTLKNSGIGDAIDVEMVSDSKKAERYDAPLAGTANLHAPDMSPSTARRAAANLANIDAGPSSTALKSRRNMGRRWNPGIHRPGAIGHVVLN